MAEGASAVTMNGQVVQEFLFKQLIDGVSKKSGRPYRMVELHDPVTLENMRLFLEEGSPVSADGLNFRDKVKAAFSMQFRFNELRPVLESLLKA